MSATTRCWGILQEARLRFLAARGFSELDAGGCGLTMVEALVQYRAQAFRGDLLEMGVALSGLVEWAGVRSLLSRHHATPDMAWKSRGRARRSSFSITPEIGGARPEGPSAPRLQKTCVCRHLIRARQATGAIGRPRLSPAVFRPAVGGVAPHKSVGGVGQLSARRDCAKPGGPSPSSPVLAAKCVTSLSGRTGL